MINIDKIAHRMIQGGIATPIGAMWAKTLARLGGLQWKGYKTRGVSAMIVSTDLDIYRAAKLMIDQYGVDAVLEAAGRADLLLEAGDMEAAAIWRRITAAIEE